MDNSAKTARTSTIGAHLGVREIRGLLTRLGHEMVRHLAAPAAAPGVLAEAKVVEPRHFIDSMRPWVRMN